MIDKISVLMYHRIIDEKEHAGLHKTYVFKEEFEKQMKYLKENNFECIFFSDLEKVKKSVISKKYIIITFDDGYLDNYEVALDILKKYNLKATIYTVSDLNYNSWDADRDKNPEKKFPLMSKEVLKKMLNSKLIELGGHTETHCNLNKISLEKMEKEINNSKLKLETELNTKMISFAYPYGAFNKKAINTLKKAGFKYGVTVFTGTYDAKKDDPFLINRFAIFPEDDIKIFEKKAKGTYKNSYMSIKKIIKTHIYLGRK